MELQLSVNGKVRRIVSEPGRSLLEVLREDLQLTGTKYGCGEGQCGACTVLIDGRAVRSCMTPVEQAEGKQIRTIEGSADNGNLHPVQRAFLETDAMQCGYCTPGMILTTVALLERKPAPSEDDIVTAMNGNICRCCTYPNYLAAVRRAAELSKEAR